MNLSERILDLRKRKGFSQEQLADALDVSRQAVSKWESDQSTPEVDKLIAMSEVFGVSLDYLLKGAEVPKEQDSAMPIVANVLAVLSIMLIMIGLLATFSNWAENQNASDIAGGMIIQVVGLASLIIAKVLHADPKLYRWISITNAWLLLYLPSTMLANTFLHTPISPYPSPWLVFIVVYGVLGTAVTALLSRMRRQ